MIRPPLLRVHPHREGPWLVVHGRRRLAVPPALGRRLLPLDGGRPGVGEVSACLGGDEDGARALLVFTGAGRSRRGPWLRLPLVPAAWVQRLAAPSAHLAGWRGLAALGAGGAGLVAWGGLPFAGAGAWPGGFALFVLGAVVHEFGHAAALARAGYPPGGIGAGLLLVLPVLWCDVSAVGLLGRAGRARVDLAGPVFQVAAAGLLAAGGRLLPGAAGQACAAGAAGSLLAVAWSLTPVFRADGFWLLGDLLGVDDLDRLPRRGDPGRTVVLLAGYRLVHGAFFGAVGAAALGRAGLDDLRGAAALVLGAFLLLVAVRRLAQLAVALRRR